MKLLLKTLLAVILPLSLQAQEFGPFPALFDDFSYTNTDFPIVGDSTNSLYGKNTWQTESGVISSRAWHRYNWGDPDNFGTYSGIGPSQNGVTLFADKGFRLGSIAPAFLSSFVLKEGMYVSCIRMSALPANTNSIEAFWLMSPDHYRFKNGNDTITHYTEIDFEWNNWFAGSGVHRMHATNVRALHSKKGLITKGSEVQFYQQTGRNSFKNLGVEIDRADEYYFENRWFYYIVKIDSMNRVTEYSMESAEEGNVVMEKVFGGSSLENDTAIAPVVITEYYPQTPLFIMYNFGTSPTNKDSVLKTHMKMDVDWFYFTPRTDVNVFKIVEEVNSLRSRGISRLNTTGTPLSRNISGIHTVVISGPDVVEPNIREYWTVEPSLKNTVYDIEFSYRFKTSSDTTPWKESPERTVELIAGGNILAIELKAIVKNIWTGETIQAVKLIMVSEKTE